MDTVDSDTVVVNEALSGHRSCAREYRKVEISVTLQPADELDEGNKLVHTELHYRTDEPPWRTEYGYSLRH